MKIADKSQVISSPELQRGGRSLGVGGDSSSPSKGRSDKKGDSVTISDAFAFLSDATIAARDISDVRMQKVLALRERIAQGTYSVSSLDVAEKLLGAAERRV